MTGRYGYTLGVSWSRGGDYSGTLEDVTGYLPKTPDVVATWGRAEPRATVDSAAGKLTFSLNNHERQFSPENTASPIYGDVLTGTPVRLSAVNPVDGSVDTIYQAPIDTLTVDDDPTNRTFGAECQDGWGVPGDTQLSTAVYRGMRTGDLVNVILDAIGWPAATRSVDAGATVVPYWWVEGVDAQTAVTDLVHSEGVPAIAYVTNGVFVFRDRHHRVTQAASLTSQGTYTHTIPAGSVSTANQVANPAFETNASGWTGFNGATLARSTTAAHTGAASLRITPDGTTSGPYAESEQHAVPAGYAWQASAWWFNGVAWATGVSVNLEWYDAGHGYLANSNGTTVPLPAGTWTQATVSGWPPAGAAYVSMNVFVAGTPANTNLFYADDASLSVVADHKILKGSFSYDHGLTHIVNSATLEVTPRVPGDPKVVWSTDSQIVLGANETATLVIRTDDPFIDLQTPSAAVTYLDDGGVLTADYHVAQGSVTFGLSRTSGQSAYLTVTAGGSGVYLDTGLRVRGTPLGQGAARVFTASDATSQALYGASDWGGAAPWAHFYDAQAIVGHVVSIYARPMPSVVFDVEARFSAATAARILATAISDRITVDNDEMRLTGDFTVEQITHTIKQAGVRHVLTIGAQAVEPVAAANPFTFDLAGAGFDQGQFSLDAANNPATMFRFDTAGHGFDQGVFAT